MKLFPKPNILLFLFVSFFFSSTVKASLPVQPVTLQNLRCEYAIDPIWIDAAQPRLSWNINTVQRNWRQKAYRLLVASSEKQLKKNIGDLWDSQQVQSSSSNQVVYKGKTLHSHQTCYWKIRVWDADGKASDWSPAAKWEMAILKDADWGAEWIGRHNNAYNEFDNSLAKSSWIWTDKQDRRSAVQLRKTFRIKTLTGIKESYLLFTADKTAEVFLNGKELQVPELLHDPKRLKKVDVRKSITAGTNILAFAAKGSEKQSGIICRLLLRYINGDSILVASDDTWKVTKEMPQGWNTQQLDDKDWAFAKIIAAYDARPWQKSVLEIPHTDPAPYLRKEFTAKGSIIRARIYASAPGFAELRLNGQKVGAYRERDPGFTRFDKRLLYAVYDVTAQLKEGKNAIGAILGTGWYDVHDQAVWLLEKAPWRGRPRLKLQLFIEYADGKTETIGSDTSWKATTGPVLFDGIYTGEIYDANKELPDWDKTVYNDTNWRNTVKMPDPGGKLVALSCPPTGVSATITPVALTEPKPGVYVIDMGENFSGHTQLSISAPKGTVITMRHAELLNKDGMLETGNIEQFMAPTNPRQPFQTDRYICKGEGTEVWEQKFTYDGFRYVEVTGLPFKPSLANFKGKFAHTLFETDGTFETSDTLINKIQKITERTYLSNAQNIPTDCPQREKNGWTGDAHLALETGLMNYNSATFYAKWLDDHIDAQLPSGLLPVIIPSADWGLHWEPEWNSAYHLIAWNLYQYYGDKRILEKHYSHLRLYTDSLAAKRKDGLTPGFGYGDWAPLKTLTPKKLTANAYLYLEADILSKMAKVLGKDTDIRKYAGLAADVKANFNKEFLDTKNHTYANSSQAALSTALYFNLVPENERAAVFQTLVKAVEATGYIDAGILGTKHLLRCLSEMGRTDLAYQLVDRTAYPGWGYWITQGATSLWGGWGKKDVKNTGSLNHIMFGDVSAWLYNNIGGIIPDPAAPGFSHFYIKPAPVGNLTWVKSKYNSINGVIAADWKKNADQFILHISIPANTSSTVVLPAKSVDQVTEGGKAIARSKDFKILKQENNTLSLALGSGNYNFEVNNGQ